MIAIARQPGDLNALGTAAERARLGETPTAALLLFGEELDDGHRRAVAAALTDLQDARVATRPLRVSRPDLGEELVDHVAVGHGLEYLPPGVDVAALGERDQVLGQR